MGKVVPIAENEGDDVYTRAMGALESHYSRKTSIVVERHRFFSRVQAPNESVDQFVCVEEAVAIAKHIEDTSRYVEELGKKDDGDTFVQVVDKDRCSKEYVKGQL
ncbi:hypothetical protein NDU88_000573 [Pleurodeles waltl]|uniref:Uncharacterized protein n=1 Tax=Pleurodeles waltl TaxID=8319 RepID=A0AAV7U6Q0_PLEWA|nr:hypothetical protein NDU88_000573 [Pleurodeles waltl]